MKLPKYIPNRYNVYTQNTLDIMDQKSIMQPLTLYVETFKEEIICYDCGLEHFSHVYLQTSNAEYFGGCYGVLII